MLANGTFLGLLGTSRAEGIETPPAFRMLVAGGFKAVEECVFFREFVSGITHLGALDRYQDLTGYEASVNSLHVEDYISRDSTREPANLARLALVCARYLAAQLRSFSTDQFRVIVSVRDRTATLRFHKIREGETWLDDDLESYEEGIGILDSNDVDVE